MSKKDLSKMSLSVLCLAGGALVSGSGGVLSSADNASDNSLDTLSNNNLIKNLNLKADVVGTNYARVQPLTGMIGSSANSSSGATSLDDGCYSNCHAYDVAIECASKGYEQTSCPTGYALSQQCPVSGGGIYYKECITTCHQDCVDQGFGTTACSTGYTKSYCPTSTSYWTCSCHTDSCPGLKTALTNAVATYRASVPSCVDYGTDETCNNAALSFGSLGYTVFSDAMTTSWSYSGFFRYNTINSTWTTNFPSTTTLQTAMNNYASCAATEGKVSFGGHFSNCHDNNCDSYLSNVATYGLAAMSAMSSATISGMADNNGGLIEKIKSLFVINNSYAKCLPPEGYYDYCGCQNDGYDIMTCSTGYTTTICSGDSRYVKCTCHTNCHSESTATTYYDRRFTYTATTNVTISGAYCRTTSLATTVAMSACTAYSTMSAALTNVESAIATAKAASCVATTGKPAIFMSGFSCYSNAAACHTDTAAASCISSGYSTSITTCTGTKNLCECPFDATYKQCITGTCLMSAI